MSDVDYSKIEIGCFIKGRMAENILTIEKMF